METVRIVDELPLSEPALFSKAIPEH